MEVEEVEVDLEEAEEARDEDVKQVEVDGSNEAVKHDGETEKSAESEVLTGAKRT